jgi:hypothetical protein
MVGEFLAAAMQVRCQQRGPERFRVTAQLKGFFHDSPFGIALDKFWRHTFEKICGKFNLACQFQPIGGLFYAV